MQTKRQAINGSIDKTRSAVLSLGSVSSAHQGCIYLIKNTVKTVML